MADTFTAKLGLRQYDAALNYDVSKFSADNLLVDNAIGTVICTSTTRPSTGLFNGMTLWETDTRRFVVRVAGAWTVASTSPVIIADAAARTAIVTPYDGMVIYRQDMDWLEIYDGAAWRVQGHVVTTALANITHPITQQTCALTTDGFLYRWTGSAWSNYACLGSDVAEYSRTTIQSIPNNTAQRIDFATTVKSISDITKSTVSGGSEFNINRAGRWLVGSNGALVGSNVGALRAWWIGTTVDTPRHAISAFSPGASVFFHGFSISKEIVFAVNDKFVIYCYQDSGSALNTEIGQSTVNVWMRWMGPA